MDPHNPRSVVPAVADSQQRCADAPAQPFCSNFAPLPTPLSVAPRVPPAFAPYTPVVQGHPHFKQQCLRSLDNT